MKPSVHPRSRGHYPPTNFQPRPNPAVSSHASPNRQPTRVRRTLLPTRCRESPPLPGDSCKPARTTAIYRNARKHGVPASPLSTSGIRMSTESRHSPQDYPTPRYNSISCYKPPSTCSTTPSGPSYPHSRKNLMPSSTC